MSTEPCKALTSVPRAVTEERRKAAHEKREKLKDEAVHALPEGYFESSFDPPLFELQGMPPNFQVKSVKLP